MECVANEKKKKKEKRFVLQTAELLDVEHLTGSFPQFRLVLSVSHQSDGLGWLAVLKVVSGEVLHLGRQGAVHHTPASIRFRLKRRHEVSFIH